MNIDTIKGGPPSSDSQNQPLTGLSPSVTPKVTENTLKELQKNENIQDPPKGSLFKESIEELANALNEHMDDLQTNLGFSLRDGFSHQIIVEIKNRKTDELIKQIPAEELLKIKEKMEELTGLIFDQKV